MAALLSQPSSTESSAFLRPNSVNRRFSATASLAASDAAIISDSHDDRATDFCFLLPHEMAARQNWNTHPEVECFTAQSASVIPRSGFPSAT